MQSPETIRSIININDDNDTGKRFSIKLDLIEKIKIILVKN